MKDLHTEIFTGPLLDHWETHYDLLSAFQNRQEEGEEGEEELSPEVGRRLARWASTQRRMQHLLPAALKNKLADINFDFKDQAPDWEEHFQQLERFHQAHGHAFLPDKDPAMELLRDWLARQVRDQQYLPEDRLRRLTELGVDWQPAARGAQRWQQMFLRLRDFYKQYGHSRVPQKWPQDRQLANWVLVQRRVYMRQAMLPVRERLLQDLQFTWDVRPCYDAQWLAFYRQLKAFCSQHGHCLVPGSQPGLVGWIERQRLAKSRNRLAVERVKLLEALPFSWDFKDIRDKHWQDMYRQLKQFQKRHGHCLVAVQAKDNKALGNWVAAQRRLAASDKLATGRQQQLDRLGFVWSHQLPARLQDENRAQWQKFFDRLRAYHQVFGTCQVSVKRDPQLQRWTRWQRHLHREGKLQASRRRQLDTLDFFWSIQEGYWLKMYRELADFRLREGHTRVPLTGLDQKLAAWTYRMRKGKARLTARQVSLLQDLGFDWQVQERTVVPWHQMYERLMAFKQAFGHTRVPATSRQDPKLGRWVRRMRQERNQLQPERRSLLEAAGFEWSLQVAVPVV